MYEYFLLILIVPLIRAIIYLDHYRFLSRVVKKHELYVQGILKNPPDDKKDISKKAAVWIQHNQIEIKKRILKTGLNDPLLSQMKSLGLGYAQQQRLSPLDNLLYNNIEILGLARNAMELARGYYKGQIIRSLNPIFWIELIVFLPKEFISLSGIDTDSKSVKGF